MKRKTMLYSKVCTCSVIIWWKAWNRG